MRNIFQFYKSVFGKITLLLALSFFAFGCHTGMEPVPIPQTTVKKEGTSRIPGEPPRNNTETNTKVKLGKNQKGPETSLHRDASGLLLPANKPAPKPVSCPTNTKSTVVAQRHTQRNPFVLPAILQEQKPAMQEPPSLAPGQQIVSNQLEKSQRQAFPMQNQSTIPLNPQEPCVAGIFDNGKDRFVLLRWHQVQGVFRCGEALGNGYYIKEITRSSVELCPQQNRYGTNSIILPFH
ncbi:MAG: hypothetical protein J6W46_02350 [Spirochaetaceae bacterium]|nr:hypothetical protein [Spirochaetaceae bacterium]